MRSMDMALTKPPRGYFDTSALPPGYGVCPGCERPLLPESVEECRERDVGAEDRNDAVAE